jgi:hypothetical protein
LSPEQRRQRRGGRRRRRRRRRRRGGLRRRRLHRGDTHGKVKHHLLSLGETPANFPATLVAFPTRTAASAARPEVASFKLASLNFATFDEEQQQQPTLLDRRSHQPPTTNDVDDGDDDEDDEVDDDGGDYTIPPTPQGKRPPIVWRRSSLFRPGRRRVRHDRKFASFKLASLNSATFGDEEKQQQQKLPHF